ncbi:MAG: hypothetical protein LBG72_08765 [Spirochaetaceae bacterium]|jgi:hypothetical protein|nr:hypothetical protein [Spirochaetaceae bacterium]
MRKPFCATIAALFFCQTIFASENKPFSIESTASQALGGYHTASDSGIFTLFSNPALLDSVEYNGIFGGGLGAVGTVAEDIALFKALTGGGPFDEDLAAGYGKKNLGWTPPELYLNGPLAAGYAAKGVGMALFDRIDFDSSIFNGKWTMNINTSLSGVMGRTFGLIDTYNHKLDAGGAVKLGLRWSMNMISQHVEVNPDAKGGTGEGPGRAGKIGLAPGINVGVLYTFRDIFSAGIQCDDIITPSLLLYLEPEEGGEPLFEIAHQKLNLGISVRPVRNGTVDWNIMLDFRDVLQAAGVFEGKARHPLLCLSAGMELTVRGVLTFRAGLRDLLPAAGIGYDFNSFTLEAAFYGREYGATPGIKSVYAFEIGFTIK